MQCPIDDAPCPSGGRFFPPGAGGVVPPGRGGRDKSAGAEKIPRSAPCHSREKDYSVLRRRDHQPSMEGAPMDKAAFTLTIKGESVKVRKKHAPVTRVVASKKLYNRKRDKQKGDDGYTVVALSLSCPHGLAAFPAPRRARSNFFRPPEVQKPGGQQEVNRRLFSDKLLNARQGRLPLRRSLRRLTAKQVSPTPARRAAVPAARATTHFQW